MVGTSLKNASSKKVAKTLTSLDSTKKTYADDDSPRRAEPRTAYGTVDRSRDMGEASVEADGPRRRTVTDDKPRPIKQTVSVEATAIGEGAAPRPQKVPPKRPQQGNYPSTSS